MPPSTFIGKFFLKSRHLGFDFFLDIWFMLEGQSLASRRDVTRERGQTHRFPRPSVRGEGGLPAGEVLQAPGGGREGSAGPVAGSGAVEQC